MIELAARGEAAKRAAFAEKYAPAIRAYLHARWVDTPRADDVEDAVQMVFVECLKENGVLARADRARAGGFRAFLYGTVRNVARRVESRDHAGRDDPVPEPALHEYEADETRLSMAFDRAWARRVMRDAALYMSTRAAERGSEAVQRVELLRLRFEEGLPIRMIAERLQREPAVVHRAYAKARREFKQSLLHVMAFYHPDDPQRAKQECAQLLAALG